MHDAMRIFSESSKKDEVWSVMQEQIVDKKHSLAKDIHYSTVCKKEWKECQSVFIQRVGYLGGVGL